MFFYIIITVTYEKTTILFQNLTNVTLPCTIIFTKNSLKPGKSQRFNHSFKINLKLNDTYLEVEVHDNSTDLLSDHEIT